MNDDIFNEFDIDNDDDFFEGFDYDNWGYKETIDKEEWGHKDHSEDVNKIDYENTIKNNKSILKDKPIKANKSIRYREIYESIEQDFKKKRLNFIRLNKLENINILNEYLNNNGYGYISSRIKELIDNSNNLSDEKIYIARLLIDSNLIEMPKINQSCSIDKKYLIGEDKYLITYDNIYGLNMLFDIHYSVSSIPFEINYVEYSNKEYISAKIDHRDNNIQCSINIQKGKLVDFTEILIIYTSYGIKEIEITVKHDEENDKQIGLKNFSEFINLCNKDIYKAEYIFNNINFENWLNDKKYISQLINYKESKEISSQMKYTHFDVFCNMNGINIDALRESYILSLESEKEPKLTLKKGIEIEPKERLEERLELKKEIKSKQIVKEDKNLALEKEIKSEQIIKEEQRLGLKEEIKLEQPLNIKQKAKVEPEPESKVEHQKESPKRILTKVLGIVKKFLK